MVVNGQATRIGQHVVLSDDTALGAGVTVGNNVTFYAKVSIGDSCAILDGAVIGRPVLATYSARAKVTTKGPRYELPTATGSGSRSSA